jgi:hypothetical protein
MMEWIQLLKINPVQLLLRSDNEVLVYFTKRDLLEEEVGSVDRLWRLSEVEKILRRQQDDGSWKYPGGDERIRSVTNYNQLQTYRILRVLVEKYGLNKNHPAIVNAGDFLFSCQTREGDFRGIYANQFTPNYSAGIMEQLIKAGYEEDERIKRCFEWLMSTRQDDGGWAIPFRTTGKRLSVAIYGQDKLETIETDKTKPSSHLITGIVLRAFAAHGEYRRSKEAKEAGQFLKSQFFKRDKYPDRVSASCWTKFSYPFWWADILSSLDSLSLLGFRREDSDVEKALGWFARNQEASGLWRASYGNPKDENVELWVALAVCRVLKRFHFGRSSCT